MNPKSAKFHKHDARLSMSAINLPHLNQNQMVRLVLLGVVLSMVFKVTAAVPLIYAFAILIGMGILLSVTVCSKKDIIYPLIILITNMTDLSQSSEEVEIMGTIQAATPWQIKIGPVTPAIIIFLFLIIAFYRIYKIPKNPFKSIFWYFLIIMTIVSYILGFAQESLTRFIADAKIAMFFCVGLVIFTSYYNRYPRSILITCQVFLSLAAGNFILDLLNLVFAEAKIIETVGYQNLSLDSGKGLILIFTFYFLSKLMQGKKVIINILLIIVSLYVLLAYQTRWLVVCFAIGLLLIAALFSVKRIVLVAVPLVIGIILAIPILTSLAPEVMRVTMLRFGFLENISSTSTLADVDFARAGSIYNSTNLLWDKKTFVTGMGYGSWYSDFYFPMHNLTISAFDDESLRTGKYYRVHDFTFNFLFKFGLIGLFLYLAAFITPLKKIWHLRKKFKSDKIFRPVAVILFGICPTAISYMWFTGKGLLFCSLLIAVAYQWEKIFRQLSNSSVRTNIIQ